MDIQEVGGGCEDWMELAQDRDRWRAFVSTVTHLRVPKMRGISWLAAEPVSFSRRTLLHGVSNYWLPINHYLLHLVGLSFTYILNIIRTLLTFIGLRIFCLCHRNFLFALQMSVILHLCHPKKQRERSLLIPSLRPFILTFSFSIKVLETGSGAHYKGEILDRSLSHLDKYKFLAFACLI